MTTFCSSGVVRNTECKCLTTQYLTGLKYWGSNACECACYIVNNRIDNYLLREEFYFIIYQLLAIICKYKYIYNQICASDVGHLSAML